MPEYLTHRAYSNCAASAYTITALAGDSAVQQYGRFFNQLDFIYELRPQRPIYIIRYFFTMKSILWILNYPRIM